MVKIKKIAKISSFFVLLIILMPKGAHTQNALPFTNLTNQEPLIRVGLFKLQEPLKFVSNATYVLKNGTGKPLNLIAPNTTLILYFDKQKNIYRAKTDYFQIESPEHLRLDPDDKNLDTIFTITSLERRVPWNKKLNFNKFRGALEVRHSEKNKKTWAINELLLETYLKGLAETSNNAPEEFQKALAITARAYALYHIQTGADAGLTDASLKHKARHFHLDAKYDQVYWGKEREKPFYKFTKAVDDTRGQIVTYKGELAVTPYFARSSGKTKTWSAVWGGTDKPWIKAVAATYDERRTQKGHGVGMSQSDAIKRAVYDNFDWEDLLKYYYNGVRVKKVF